jgi:hypothetical protein
VPEASAERVHGVLPAFNDLNCITHSKANYSFFFAQTAFLYACCTCQHALTRVNVRTSAASLTIWAPTVQYNSRFPQIIWSGISLTTINLST